MSQSFDINKVLEQFHQRFGRDPDVPFAFPTQYDAVWFGYRMRAWEEHQMRQLRASTVPGEMHEHVSAGEYARGQVNGWNQCRAAMLGTMEQP